MDHHLHLVTVTYDNETHSVSYSICPNIQSSNYTLTSTSRRILLPQNYNQLNDYMCNPMNRKGIACSECANGFGPSFISLWYNCVSCSDTWYGVPLFICLLRRSWNTKNDIIDVFITFLFLSYSKYLYQTVLLLLNQRVFNYTESGKLINAHNRITIDLTVAYGSKGHLFVLIPALIVLIIFNIAPPILLILHPCKIFSSCLSRCRLNYFVVNIFVDKLQGCYRDGLEEGRDICGAFQVSTLS